MTIVEFLKESLELLGQAELAAPSDAFPHGNGMILDADWRARAAKLTGAYGIYRRAPIDAVEIPEEDEPPILS